MATGEDRSTWGVKANNDFSLVETAITGVVTITMTDANVVLTTSNGAADQARSAVLVFNGTNTAIRNIQVPTVSKVYIVKNATINSFALTMNTSAIGSVAATIPANSVYQVYCDGTSVFLVQPIINAGAVGLGNVDNTSDVNKPVSTAQAAAILSASPTGHVAAMITKTAPTGWLPLTGQLISRTTYATLWAFAQASGMIAGSDATWSSSSLFGQFSPGDGSTTFRVPFYAGYFLRPWVASGGIDSGRNAGDVQASANLAHNHGITDAGHAHSTSQSAHAHGVSDPGHAHTILGTDGTVTSPYVTMNGNNNSRNGATQAALTGISIAGNTISIGVNTAGTGITINNSGSTEARPVNISVPYYIKY